MKNKYYNIFFTSEHDGIGKSFRVSIHALLIVTPFIIFSFFLLYLGMHRFFGSDDMLSEINRLREYKYITSNLLIESGVSQESIKSEELEKIIVDYIIVNDMIYPENPPVDGYVTKGVIKNGNQVIYAGINIASKLQENVESPLPGIVVLADKNDELGNTIILHHQNNFFTIYGYLDTMFIQARDLVNKGDIIGKVGSQEGSGPNLYFEIWKDNQVIDPRNLINNYKVKDVSI